MVDDLVSLGMLILLQAVLGFDNLLYVSIESKRAPLEHQKSVRAWGIGLAIVLRIVLLFTLYYVIEWFQDPWFSIGTDPELAEEGSPGFAYGTFNGHSLIVLAGGAFIIYTATKEVLHMMHLEHEHNESKPKRSVVSVVTWIMIMNVVFSFDSILSAMALTKTLWVMITAIVISGILMIWLADHVSEFLKKNRMYEVLGLFILFVVGIMLLTEGAHLAHLHFFGNAVNAMSKTTFYFVIVVLVLTDIVQSRYRLKILAEQRNSEAAVKKGRNAKGQLTQKGLVSPPILTALAPS
jgi:predicted tellurium resistance membrane protein TerC